MYDEKTMELPVEGHTPAAVHRRWLLLSILSIVLLILALFTQHEARELGELTSYKQIEIDDQVQAVVYHEDADRYIIGSYQNRVVSVDSEGTVLWSFDTQNVVTDLFIREDGNIYAASDDQHIYLLDPIDGELLQDLFIQRRVYDIDVDETRELIAVSAGSTASKHFVMLYDYDGNLQWRYQIPSVCRKISFSTDHQRIYVGSDRAQLIALSADGSELYRVKLRSAVKGIVTDADSEDIAVITEYGTYYRLDGQGSILFSADYPFGEDVTGFGADKDLELVALGGKFGEMYILDEQGRIIFSEERTHTISTFTFTDDELLVGSFGEPVYRIPLKTFTGSRLAILLQSYMEAAAVLLLLFIIVTAVLSFQVSRDKAVHIYRVFMKHKVAYLLLLPTFIMLIIFMYYPMIIAFIRGFTDWNVRSEQIHFIGFDNFRRMVTEGYFLLGLKNLFLIAFADMLKILTVPLLVAELVFAMKRPRTKYLFRFLFVLPMVVPLIVTVLMWKNIYDPAIGLLNNLLAAMNLENLQRVWLGDPGTALGSIIAMNFPFIDGFAFLIYYGGLINIPSQLFEAAKVDGAGRMWNFTRIHLPLLTPQFKMLIILKFIGSIQNFMPIYILTGGGPGEITYVPGLELYYHATTFGNYGYACALGMAMFVFIFIGTYFNMKLRTQSQN